MSDVAQTKRPSLQHGNSVLGGAWSHLAKHLKPDGLMEKIDQICKEENSERNIEVVKQAVDVLYPGISIVPTAQIIDDSVLLKGGQREDGKTLYFKPGMWLEYSGLNQAWTLGMVRRVVVHYDHITKEKLYSYNCGKSLDFPDYLVRAPEEGIKRVFGLRPFAFLQWAALKMEQKVRFQESHEHDLEQLHFESEVAVLWQQFLDHPNNVEFHELVHSVPEIARLKLEHFVLSTFRGCDRLTKLSRPGERWDLKSQEISVYSYPSLLGSGFFTVGVVAFIQIVAPAVLLISAVELQSSRFPSFFYTPQFYKFCHAGNFLSGAHWEGKVLNICVLLVYVFRVFPIVLEEWYQTTADGDTVKSRLIGLRQSTYAKGTDTLYSQIGFKMEKYMKTAYTSALQLLMLFVLFLTDDPIAVILNAIAIEFIWTIDVSVSEGPFYDPGERYLRAGALECRLRDILDFDSLNDTKMFCKHYNIDESNVASRFGGKLPNIPDAARAEEDVENNAFLTDTEIMWKAAAEVSVRMGKSNAVWQFEDKPIVNFGFFDQWLIDRGITQRGIFNRFAEYRTWSVWEVLLFAPAVPKTGSRCDSKYLESNSKNNGAHYLHFDRKAVSDPWTRFGYHILDTLTFRVMAHQIELAGKKRNPVYLVWKVVDSIFEWFVYVFQLMFPIVLFLDGILIVACY